MSCFLPYDCKVTLTLRLGKHFHLSWINTHLQIAVASHCGEESAELEGKAFNLPVGLRSSPHPWSRAVGKDRMNESEDTSSGNFLRGVAGVSSGHLEGAQSTATALSCLKEPAEVILIRMLSRHPS